MAEIKEFTFKEGMDFEGFVEKMKESVKGMLKAKEVKFVGLRLFILDEESDILAQPQATTIDLSKYLDGDVK